METKDFRVELKALDESGTFSGVLASYGNVDEGGDVIDPGAFTKTLSEGSGTIPLLWSHNQSEPIGTLQLTDTPTALLCHGKLVLDVPKAREAHALMRAGVVKGLSIGFKTIKALPTNFGRRLKEVRLFEGSLTPIPMNAAAVVTSVKQLDQPAPDTELLDAFRNAARDIKNWHRRMIDGE